MALTGLAVDTRTSTSDAWSGRGCCADWPLADCWVRALADREQDSGEARTDALRRAERAEQSRRAQRGRRCEARHAATAVRVAAIFVIGDASDLLAACGSARNCSGSPARSEPDAFSSAPSHATTSEGRHLHLDATAGWALPPAVAVLSPAASCSASCACGAVLCCRSHSPSPARRRWTRSKNQ